MKRVKLQSNISEIGYALIEYIHISIVFLGVFASLNNAYAANIEDAQSPEEKGLAIAIAADERDEGWNDWSANSEMILRNRHGESSTRQLRMSNLEQEIDGDKRLIIFDYPRDVKGTAFLVFTKKIGNDDQWLYLPALKRVKRIASNNQSGPFVGSEFAYEDLSSQEVEKYTYNHLRDEVIGGIDSYVIERYPVDEKSGYTRQVVWIDKNEYRTLRTDYYDRKGEILKTLTAHDYKLYKDHFWRANRFVMINHQTGKSTDLVWNDYEFSKGLSERNFDRNSLQRAR